jgi:hypothetical protein
MAERVATVEQAAAAFRTFAAAEGDAVPMYARLCEVIADDAELSGLLLHAPSGQRLPVLLLAALHDLVLRRPDIELAAWYPSVGGSADHDGDLQRALRRTVDADTPELLDVLRHRRVQTNEVNRCVAWRMALQLLCGHDERPLHLVELGASAGLNLGLDRYRVDVHGVDVHGPEATLTMGPADAAVRLSTRLRGGGWPELRAAAAAPLPPVAARVGVDAAPLDPADPDDARWLTACVWPEQHQRLTRLRAALADAAAWRVPVLRGDLVDELGELTADVGHDRHVVVLSSWALVYVPTTRRQDLCDRLADLARAAARRRSRVTLLSFEADHVLPWVVAPALPDDGAAELRHSSLLAATEFDEHGRHHVRPLARCQAHITWTMPILGT